MPVFTLAVCFRGIPSQAAPQPLASKPLHILSIRPRFEMSPYDAPSLLTFSPDGKTLATGGENCGLNFWDTHNGKEKRVLPRRLDSTYEIGYSPNGRLFATGTSRLIGVQLWDARSGKLVRTLKEPYPASKGAHVFDFDFSPDGRTLAAVTSRGEIQLWEVGTGKLRRKFTGVGKQYTVTFSPDGNTFASASPLHKDKDNFINKTIVRLWDVRNGNLKRSWRDAGWPITFSPDGRQLITQLFDKNQDSTVTQWSVRTGALLQRSKKSVTAHGDANPIDLSPNGRLLVTGHSDKTVRVTDARNGELLQELQAGEDMILSAKFSPDGSVLATGSLNAQARLWRVRK